MNHKFFIECLYYTGKRRKNERNIVYRTINDISLKLDLFLPDNDENPPLIMWIHSGARIIDCKHALAFLRKNENKYPMDVSEICVSGDSAGGHLAALMGVTACHSEWEPERA